MSENLREATLEGVAYYRLKASNLSYLTKGQSFHDGEKILEKAKRSLPQHPSDEIRAHFAMANMELGFYQEAQIHKTDYRR